NPAPAPENPTEQPRQPQRPQVQVEYAEEETFMAGIPVKAVAIAAAVLVAIVAFLCILTVRSVPRKAELYRIAHTGHLSPSEDLVTYVRKYVRRNENNRLYGVIGTSSLYDEAVMIFYPSNVVTIQRSSFGITTENRDYYYDLIGDKLYIWNNQDRTGLDRLFNFAIYPNYVQLNDLKMQMSSDFHQLGKADYTLSDLRRYMNSYDGEIDPLFEDIEPVLPSSSSYSNDYSYDNTDDYLYDDTDDYSYDDSDDYSTDTDDYYYDDSDWDEYTWIGYVSEEDGPVYLYDDPDLYDDSIICAIPDGEAVVVYEYFDGKYFVQYRDTYGYINGCDQIFEGGN
ncbi:MAG: hypothetical protein ACI4XW_13920, partial [Candidatus Spyradocola sp.]